MMKKGIAILSLCALLLAGLTPGALATGTAGTAWDQLLEQTLASVEQLNNPATRLEVTGSGTVSVTPDIAVISVGVSMENAEVQAAQEAANQTMQNILDALLALGIAQTDLATSNYSVYPTYDYSGDTRLMTGYQVSSQLTVTVRDFEQVNRVIDTAVEQGANDIGSLTFDVSDQTLYYQQALAAAVANGQSKATALAQAAGKTLGNLVEVVEEGSSAPLYARVQSLDAQADAGTNIQSGQTQISATVTLVYQLQP